MAAPAFNVIHAQAETVLRERRSFSRRVHTQEKLNGVHYTPPDLAAFLAQQMAEGLKRLEKTNQLVNVLDPACGDGELLKALAEAVPPSLRARLVLHGVDTDECALQRAKLVLASVGVQEVQLHCADFLSAAAGGHTKSQMSLALAKPIAQPFDIEGRFDAVISNPPYVRTQVLGAEVARQLAVRFDLSGRVDLYHAFVKAMTFALRDGGVLGLLTSNRFLFIRSGESMRQWLLKHFHLMRLVDLGDTKLFNAAVLPAVLVAERSHVGKSEGCEFIRVYEDPNGSGDEPRQFESILDALDGSFHGAASVNSVRFRVDTGHLQTSAETSMPWSIASDQVDSWLETVKRHSAGQFSDFGKICVGIKTTADSVFIRDDWETLREKERPEEILLRPLITHHTASRWSRRTNGRAIKRVLYPYTVVNGRRALVNLAEYPNTRAYLEQNRAALERRTYVTNSGRKWYEIWVAHHPDNWSLRKIAFPDISDSGNFFVADEGWVVNGDCYWIKLLPGIKEDWLLLMLAVANSSFILKFYDVRFHNKLYSGRRRFQSQYVERFPLPKLENASELLDVVSRLVTAAQGPRKEEMEQLESVADDLVWKAFGLNKEITR